MQPTAGNSRKKKQRSQPTIEANRGTEEQERVESKVESTYWRFFTGQVLASLFTLPFFCTVLWTPTKRTMPDTCVVRPIHAAWCLERCEASYACVVINLQVDAIRKSLSFSWWVTVATCKESDKPQKVGPLRQEEAKHCNIRIGCVRLRCRMVC